MAIQIPIDHEAIAAFCRRHHIRKLSIFGSATREDFRAESDVDVLVEFEPGHVPGWEFFDLQDELASVLGRSVDLNTPGFLSARFRDQVVRDSVNLYES